MGDQYHLPRGTLPYEARLWLQAAARVGSAGSKERRIAIGRAYDRIDREYPELIKDK